MRLFHRHIQTVLVGNFVDTRFHFCFGIHGLNVFEEVSVLFGREDCIERDVNGPFARK